MISGDTILELRRLQVRFGPQVVLREISLQVARGETLAIIGESGCGKTVLLKSMIGLVRPSRGEALFDGKRLADLAPKELALERIRFGYVFQNAALFDSMTVAQNVAFPLRQHRKLSRADVRDIVVSRLQEVGLQEDVLGKKPEELSGGMRKRVGLARALVMNPEVLLYDEPTTGLDPIMSDVINQLILRTRARYQVTSVLVTHDMNTARQVADRIVMIHPLARLDEQEPQIIFAGAPEEIDEAEDLRVRQFVRGEAGERISETIESPARGRRGSGADG